MQRVMIVGQPGSGKSTLARRLGAVTGLPVVHIDHIHWQDGWVERPRDDTTRLCHDVEARAAWIFEGGHSLTWANRMARADLVVWLDLPVTLRMWRVLMRSVVWQGRARPDLPAGCPERFGPETLPFWAYIWRTRASGRRNIERLRDAAPPGKRWVHLRCGAEVEAFLNGLAT
ncbi:MAG: AAA family ATPase [bacterium]